MLSVEFLVHSCYLLSGAQPALARRRGRGEGGRVLPPPTSKPATVRDPLWDTSRWLPTTRDELDARGWDEVDVILVTGDAYVDHPSFGAAVVGRIIEREGLRVAILPQPNWRDDLRDFKKLGRPRLFFGVTAGCMDSMVNRYTAGRRLRSDDAYTPGGLAGKRPDRASMVYSQRCREAYKNVPIVLGGIEASLRRIAHYDYWQDKVRHSILMDAKADILLYGNGFKKVINRIEPNESKTVTVLPKGESSVTMEAVTPLKYITAKDIGYFDRDGDFKVQITIRADYNVETKVDLNIKL